MTYQEIAEQARQLPIQLRLALIDVITRSLQADLSDAEQASASASTPRAQHIPANSALRRIRGIAATNPPLTDAAVDAILADDRVEKHTR